MVERVVNGGFETGDFTGWSYVAASGVDGASAYSGSYGNYFVATSLPSVPMGRIANIDQSINLTDVDELTFYYAMPVHNVSNGSAALRIWIDTDTVLWTSASGSTIPYTYQSIDVSAYSGSHQVHFGSTKGSSSGGGDFKIRYDDISAVTILPMQINISDVWKEVDSVKINIGDTWKDVVSVKQNIGDIWKTVF